MSGLLGRKGEVSDEINELNTILEERALTQSKEIFRGLNRIGIDTIVVRYVKSSHSSVWAPELMMDRFKRGLDWMNKYVT